MSDTVNEIEQTPVENQSQEQVDSMTEVVNQDIQENAEPNNMTEALQSDKVQEAQPSEIDYSFKDADGNESSDTEYVTHVKGMSKELGLSQEQAQKFFDKARDKVTEINTHALETAKSEWINQTLSDDEIGGQHLTESRNNALKAIRSFGSNEFKNLLIHTGIIEHPEIIRFLSRVGKATSNDAQFIDGEKTNHHKKSFLREIYGQNSPELFDE